jgi:A/G-specific adenine glycosylase
VREFGAEAVIPLAPFTHVFTHFRLEIEPRIADIGAAQAAGGMLVAASADTEWVPLARLDAYGLPAPVRKLLDSLSGPLI